MIEISVKDVYKSFGDQQVLKGVSFKVFTGEKVALIGGNGCGKSTILKILTNREFEDYGEVDIPKSQIVACLDQIPVYEDSYTVLDVLKDGFKNIYDIKAKMEELEPYLATDEIKLKQYGDLLSELEALDGYNIDANIMKICNALLISQDLLERSFNLLSGGEKTRINMARIILSKPDILLLDEPTNHLDISSLEWLEQYLKETEATVLIVSHDRYFLDRVVDKIFELENGKINTFKGNYSDYAVQKEELQQQQELEFENIEKKLKQLEIASRRMHDWANRADNPSMHKRAFAIEKRIEKLKGQMVERPIYEREMKTTFLEESFSSQVILDVNNLTKAYNKELFTDLSFSIQKNQHVALLGDNGTGKTTLLKILRGEVEADCGDFKLGASVVPGYLEQHVEFENKDESILLTLCYAMGIGEERGRKILAGFKFTGEDVFKKVGTLSGGEKSRLRLCILMQKGVNFLILDEPTNHLDIKSREWLEEALDEFSGTMLFVSHDRYFISRFADRVVELDPTLALGNNYIDYKGAYEDYLKWKGEKLSRVDFLKHVEKTKEKKKEPEERKKQERQLSPMQKQKAIDKLEREIGKLELEIEEMKKEMEENPTDYQLLESLQKDIEKKEEEILILYEKIEEV